MGDKRWLYWVLQFLGWGSILSLSLLGQYLKDGKIEWTTLFEVLVFLALALSVTHAYRAVIIKLNWLNKNLNKAIQLILLGSLFLSLILLLINYGVDWAFGEKIELEGKRILFGIINFYVLSIIWTIIYFAFHYFDKSRMQEVKNLQLESSQKESELSNLKNQLNPHFMFNAMNSIRALVDENPILAKKSITQLSNLLRNTLQLGNKRLVTVQEEMKIVNDYLALEKIRFEERLQFDKTMKADVLNAFLPPLMIQTLIENAIKHGISKVAAGGVVSLHISNIESKLCVEVLNDGVYKEDLKSKSGIGLENTRQRLRILYGAEATLEIGNVHNKVLTKISIPFQTH